MNRRPVAIALGALAVATLAVHLATNGRYGFFRDELYFVMCGQRLDWGYVDQPAGIALIARVATELFGLSLVGLRVPAALAAAALVALTGAFAVRLGGAVFAAVLAAVCVAVAPAVRDLGAPADDERVPAPRLAGARLDGVLSGREAGAVTRQVGAPRSPRRCRSEPQVRRRVLARRPRGRRPAHRRRSAGPELARPRGRGSGGRSPGCAERPLAGLARRADARSSSATGSCTRTPRSSR